MSDHILPVLAYIPADIGAEIRKNGKRNPSQRGQQ